MIKMFLSSFYNTIIDEEDAIPASTVLKIDAIRQKKIRFGITTNRLQEEVLYYNQDYPFIDYIISLNGSVIYDVKKDKTTLLSSFTKKELEEITNEFPKKEIWYYTKEEVWNCIPEEKVYKIEVKKTKEWKTNKYYTSTFLRDGETFLEIGKNQVQDALRKLKVKEEEIVCVIGNESEEDLLACIPKTYVVKNALKRFKEKAKYLTNSNRQKGVEEVMDKEL